MTRKLKTLGLALVAVFAMSAIAAQAASAQESHEFTSDSENGRTVFTGANENIHKFFVGENFVECDHAFFEGTEAESPADDITVKPIYFSTDDDGLPTDCTAASNPAAVNVNDCAYIFDSDTDENGHANVDIECKEGHRIEIELTGLGTTLTVNGQTGPNGVHYETKANHEGTGKSAVTVDATVDGIDTTCEGFFCFLFETGADTGEYVGTATVTGYEDVNGPETEPTTPDYDDNEGNLVNVTVE